MPKFYYAAHSNMGLSYTYDSPCWMVHAFTSKSERDNWVKENKYDNGNLVAEAVDGQTARKIAPELRTEHPSRAWRVVCH